MLKYESKDQGVCSICHDTGWPVAATTDIYVKPPKEVCICQNCAEQAFKAINEHQTNVARMHLNKAINAFEMHHD